MQEISKKLLFRLSDRDTTELLEVFHQVKGGLTGTGTGSLVALDNLRFSVEFEEIHVLFDFLYKIFHGVVIIKMLKR